MSVKIWKIVLFTEKEIATEEKISKKHCKMYNTEGKQSCEKCKREWWGRIRAPKEQREVRERERRRINKGRWCFRASGRQGRKKEGGEREKHKDTQGGREKPTDSKMKERQESRWETRENWRREGGCWDERERGGGEAVGERGWVKCQTDK